MPSGYSSYEPEGQEDNCGDEAQSSADSDSDDAKRQKKKPCDRVNDQGQQGERPAEHEEDAPQQEFDHGITFVYILRTQPPAGSIS